MLAAAGLCLIQRRVVITWLLHKSSHAQLVAHMMSKWTSNRTARVIHEYNGPFLSLFSLLHSSRLDPFTSLLHSPPTCPLLSSSHRPPHRPSSPQRHPSPLHYLCFIHHRLRRISSAPLHTLHHVDQLFRRLLNSVLLGPPLHRHLPSYKCPRVQGFLNTLHVIRCPPRTQPPFRPQPPDHIALSPHLDCVP